MESLETFVIGEWRKMQPPPEVSPTPPSLILFLIPRFSPAAAVNGFPALLTQAPQLTLSSGLVLLLTVQRQGMYHLREFPEGQQELSGV